MEMYVSDRVRFEAGLTTVRGEIVDITIAPVPTGEMAPWITIETLTGEQYTICGTDEILARQGFKVTFSDFPRAA